MEDPILIAMRRRPAVHQLCSGLYLQEPLQLHDDLLAVPLRPLGYGSQANYAAQYSHEIAGAPVDQGGLTNLISQGQQALPVVCIVRTLAVDGSPDELERFASDSMTHARRILSWVAADEISPFAMVICTNSQSYFRMLPPSSRQRQRLGFGNTGDSFNSMIRKLMDSAATDEHFSFALSLFHDAQREENSLFKIARLFNCLECLAASLKAKHEGKSRRAVKELFGDEIGTIFTTVVTGKPYTFDVVEISGRLRDRLFHGVPFRRKDLIEEYRPVFELLETDPKPILDSVQSLCEVEIARWANGVSRGKAVQPGTV